MKNSEGKVFENRKRLHFHIFLLQVLKDIINRYNLLQGYGVHYVPGWDCHGLPIELKALSKNKKQTLSDQSIRATCRFISLLKSILILDVKANFTSQTILKKIFKYDLFPVNADTYSVKKRKKSFDLFDWF